MGMSNRMTLELRPLYGGSYTQLSLQGPLTSAPLPLNMRRLLTMFSHWNGYPVDVVLPVEVQTAGWCEVWTDALCAVPAGHHRVIFHVASALKVSEPR